MKKKIALLLLALMVFGTVQAWAAPSCPLANWADDKAQSESYGTKLMGQAVLGVDQILTSPINLVWYPYDGAKNEGVKGFFTGLGQGLLETGEAIVSGAVNLVSSPIPGYHGIRYKNKAAATA